MESIRRAFTWLEPVIAPAEDYKGEKMIFCLVIKENDKDANAPQQRGGYQRLHLQKHFDVIELDISEGIKG